MRDSKLTRRVFMERSGIALGVLVSGCTVKLPSKAEARHLLLALADVALPTQLDKPEREKVVAGFWNWLDAYEKGWRRHAPRELPSEIHLEKHSPTSPKGLYLQQLGTLNEKCQGQFASLSREKREEVLSEHLAGSVPQDLEFLPWPAALAGMKGDHVALALTAYFLYSTRGRQLAEQALVEPFTCRSLTGVSEPPSAS